MPIQMDQICHDWTPVQIQVIHREQKLPLGLIGSQPATKVINETVELPQISIPLGVTPMEGLLISGNGHQQINAVRSIDIFTCSIASLLPHGLSKSTILILNFELALIRINYILSTLPKPSIWIYCISVEVANMHVQRQVCPIRCGGCRLPC
jgi:hypothetical protein